MNGILRSNQTDWCMRAPSGTTQASQISTGKTQTHIHKHKNTHTQIYNCTQIYATNIKHWLQELLLQRVGSCSVNLWICEQSHPNILLSITFLYIQLHTPSSYISSPSTASDLQFSIPRFSRRPPPRIMIAFALTSQLYIHLTPLHFHVSALEYTLLLS